MMPVWILRVLCRPASVTRGFIQGEADARTISTIYGATLAHLSGGDARPTLKRTHMPAAIMAPDTMRTPMPVGEWSPNRPVCASHRQVVAASYVNEQPRRDNWCGVQRKFLPAVSLRHPNGEIKRRLPPPLSDFVDLSFGCPLPACC